MLRLVKICASPDCPYTPYFIANDTRLDICSTDCADAMQDKCVATGGKAHGKTGARKKGWQRYDLRREEKYYVEKYLTEVAADIGKRSE